MISRASHSAYFLQRIVCLIIITRKGADVQTLESTQIIKRTPVGSGILRHSPFFSLVFFLLRYGRIWALSIFLRSQVLCLRLHQLGLGLEIAVAQTEAVTAQTEAVTAQTEAVTAQTQTETHHTESAQLSQRLQQPTQRTRNPHVDCSSPCRRHSSPRRECVSLRDSVDCLRRGSSSLCFSRNYVHRGCSNACRG